MGVWGYVFIIIGIILGVAIYQGGFEGLKSNPIQSTVSSAKTIIDTGKNIIDYTKGANTTEIGMIPCTSNEDCNKIIECQNSSCLCYDDGICRR